MAVALPPQPLKPPRFVIVLKHHFKRFTGGAEMQAWMLATELARRGWDVHYVSESAEQGEPVVLEGVTLHGIPSPRSVWLGNRRALKTVLHALRPDVIYSRIFSPYLGWVTAGAPRGTFCVWSTASRFDGRAFPLLHSGRRGMNWRDFLRRLPVYLYWDSIARKGRRSVNLILAQQSEQQRDIAARGLKAEILRNSHPPVPAGDCQSHEGTPLILWADSIKPSKRPEAFLELARRCRDLDATFVMLGKIHDPVYQAQIDAAVRDLPRFRYDGFVPLVQIYSYFRAAHLHVKTSLPIEGFPNTFVQSWLHGVPVVSLEVDLENWLSSGELGICTADTDALEAAVRKLINQPELRREIGARARARAVEEFDLTVNVNRLEGLLAARGVRLPVRS